MNLPPGYQDPLHHQQRSGQPYVPGDQEGFWLLVDGVRLTAIAEELRGSGARSIAAYGDKLHAIIQAGRRLNEVLGDLEDRLADESERLSERPATEYEAMREAANVAMREADGPPLISNADRERERTARANDPRFDRRQFDEPPI